MKDISEPTHEFCRYAFAQNYYRLSFNPATTAIHEDDEYELLAKGLGGYNQGVGTFLNIIDTSPRTWGNLNHGFEFLVGGVSDTQKKAIKYAITIMHSNQMMALPYRSYVWRGGVYGAGS